MSEWEEDVSVSVDAAGLLAVALVAAGWVGMCESPDRVIVVMLLVVVVFGIIYDRFLLPSKFLKLDGLIFISANSIECSWPFQWNQFTPWRKKI